MAELVRRTTEEAPPDGGTHKTVRAMAAATGVLQAKVHCDLARWEFGAASLTADQALQRSGLCALKVEGAIGLHADPLRPAGKQGRSWKSSDQEAREAEHAVVLSIDEKSQIQA